VGAQAAAAVAVVIVPAILMVSTIRFRSFKTINFGWTPSYINIILVAGLIALIATAPQITLLVIAYGYLLSAFIEMALTRNRPADEAAAAPPEA
jgi:CDP-diacylglycerol--serine O-phosphatidyltransferase